MTETHITERQFSRFIKSAEAVKDAVNIMDVAGRYVDLQRRGGNYVGLCPFHEEKSASFTVFPDTNRFHCFGCKEGGDVLDLHRRCGNYGSLWEAAVDLATEFGVELPVRSDRWHKWQDQKGKIRAAAKADIAKTYQRRLTRVYASLALTGGEEPGEAVKELDKLSSALWPISLEMAARRVNGG